MLMDKQKCDYEFAKMFLDDIKKGEVKQMKTGEKDTKPRTGIVNIERRIYPRFSVNLPIEYYRIDSSISHTGRGLNISEGGLLIYFPEEMDLSQYLSKLPQPTFRLN